MDDRKGASRRSFLKGSGLALGAAALAGSTGLLTGCSSSGSGQSGDYKWDDSADVIVIGGGTGTMSAIYAAQSGASVILLEKMTTFTGDTALSGGVITAAESVVQEQENVVDERTGQPDTKASFLADWLESNNLGVESPQIPELVEKLVDKSPEVIQFFVDRGVEFCIYQSGSAPVKRGHGPYKLGESGAYGIRLCEPMVAEAESLGVNLINNTRAMDILKNDKDEIVGIRAKTAEGDIKYYGCKALILATGGNGGNLEMTARYNQEALNWINIGGDFGTADGIIMAQEINAKTNGYKSWLDPIRSQLTSGAVAGTRTVDLGVMITEVVHAQPVSTLMVTADGERFVNEDRGYPNGIMSIINHLPAGFCYRIFDSQLHDQFPTMIDSLDPYGGLEGLVEKGFIRKADTIEALADQMKIKPETLAATVARYNGMVDAGADSDFERRSVSLARVEKPPFYAWQIVAANATPGAGAAVSIAINENFGVIDTYDQVIPGLYAVGGVSSASAMGWGYVGSGTGNLIGLAGGCYAGPSAAEFAASKS